MLISLSVRNVVLIDRLDLAFGPGLTALTGETGAGKSILLDALGLAVGARADAGLVRPGTERASVTAAFALGPDHPVRALLDERGIEAEEGDLVLRRVIGADGRGRAFVNDQPAGVALLREVGEALVEIQGQGGARSLISVSDHRRFLDGFAALGREAEAVAHAYQTWREAEAARAEAAAALERLRRDEDYLRHVVAELEALAPEPGEEAALAERRAVLMQGERVAEALRAAVAELDDGRGVEARLRAAERHLARAAERVPGLLDAALEALDRAAIETAEASAAIEAAARECAPDPEALDAAERRLFALRAAARKHDTTVDELPALRDALAARLAALDDRGESLAALAVVAEKARADFAAAARALTAARARAADRLDAAIAAELGPLGLAHARFRTRIEPLAEEDWGAGGAERVRFTVATVDGAAPGPLGRIASGGELSRLLLALRVVLARTAETATLVFDEVDSGIGGATAAAVGERLARLGAERQVLVVTHSPQVAARADHHLRVAKVEDENGVRAAIEALDASARREEVARMLAGARVTDAARAAADSLMRARAG